MSFEESTELFKSDVDYLEIYDEEHSEHEDRFIAVGPIAVSSWWHMPSARMMFYVS